MNTNVPFSDRLPKISCTNEDEETKVTLVTHAWQGTTECFFSFGQPFAFVAIAYEMNG